MTQEQIAYMDAAAATTVGMDYKQRFLDALDQHELPMSAVNVTLTHYDRRHRRELT